MKKILEEEPYAESPVEFKARMHRKHIKDVKAQAKQIIDKANWKRKQGNDK